MRSFGSFRRWHSDGNTGEIRRNTCQNTTYLFQQKFGQRTGRSVQGESLRSTGTASYNKSFSAPNRAVMAVMTVTDDCDRTRIEFLITLSQPFIAEVPCFWQLLLPIQAPGLSVRLQSTVWLPANKQRRVPGVRRRLNTEHKHLYCNKSPGEDDMLLHAMFLSSGLNTGIASIHSGPQKRSRRKITEQCDASAKRAR